MTAALYRGTVRHRRVRHEADADFTHPLTLLYADLDELPRTLGGRLVRRFPGLVRVRPRDLYGRTGSFDALRAALRATVAEQTGRPAPTGRIAVLTHPRVAGLCFNPVSFYYLFDEAGELDTVVAEVTSTPWRERHAYVLRAAVRGPGDGVSQPDVPAGVHAEADADPSEANPAAVATDDGGLSGEHAKAMRVSPFQPMEQRYRWTISRPGEQLTARIVNHAAGDGGIDLAATLRLTREPLTVAAVRGLLRRHPAGTLRILGLIYGHAVALKVRGARIHSREPIGQGGA